VFLAFLGERRADKLGHESHWTLLVPLAVLAALSVVGGHLWVATPTDVFAHDVQPWFRELVSLQSMYGTPKIGVIRAIDPDQSRAIHSSALAVSIAAAGLGLLIAWFVYVSNARTPSPAARKSNALSRAAANSYHIDRLVQTTLVVPVRSLARLLAGVDRHGVDGVVNAGGFLARLGGRISATFDRVVVDGAVNALGALTALFGSLVRLLQTGRIQQYAAFALIGGVAAAAWLILSQ
jgi:NADH-quinone oxidoreductase subunit L